MVKFSLSFIGMKIIYHTIKGPLYVFHLASDVSADNDQSFLTDVITTGTTTETGMKGDLFLKYNFEQ